MAKIKRTEAWGLLGELKAFAFEQSIGFRQGTQLGLEVSKSFYHQDPRPPELAEIMAKEMCKSDFVFRAFRMASHKPKPFYSYELAATMERTISHVPEQILPQIPKRIRKYYKNFKEAPDGALVEKMGSTYSTSDGELREIEVSNHYGLLYAGSEIYAMDDDEILYGGSMGEEVAAPAIESDYDWPVIFVQDGIEHEQLMGAENVITNIDFWAVINGVQDDLEVGSYRAAATCMRSIVHTLRTGHVQ